MARRRSSTSRKRSRLGLTSILLLLAGLSLAQYLDTGSLQWPTAVKPAAEALLADVLSATTSDPAEADSPSAVLPQSIPGNTAIHGEAVRITDGDTFTLRLGSEQDERIRLHGIDTPERDQPFGPAAGTELARLIEGREVRVDVVERDYYGRIVGRVWTGDLDINLALVESGHAWWYEYYAQERRDLELAEEAARRAQRGLWAQRNPVPPWEWRRNQR
jgi:endonuclease YncB( thermonuclease family)